MKFVCGQMWKIFGNLLLSLIWVANIILNTVAYVKETHWVSIFGIVLCAIWLIIDIVNIVIAFRDLKRFCEMYDEQIKELKSHVDDINYEEAKAREKLVRHDVMSHVYAYGLQCPKAAGIIHLGATSCYVGDNTDVIVMTEAMKLVRKKLLNVIAELAKFAEMRERITRSARGNRWSA